MVIRNCTLVIHLSYTNKYGRDSKNVPQFQSPEEELQFLRSTVQQQETLLKERGVAMPREEIANTVVREYRTLEASRVIPSTDRMDQAESEKFVLRLRPESHDTVMEEVLTILLSKVSNKQWSLLLSLIVRI